MLINQKVSGGETGIRTLGTLAGSTVFETATFDHSVTSPRGGLGGGDLERARANRNPLIEALVTLSWAVRVHAWNNGGQPVSIT
jgi:hypothetical protein